MTFSTFATYLDKLEETSSRLTLIEILGEVFKQIHKDEIDKVIYLMQGRVAPFYAPIEMGMAEKMVASAIALAFGEEREAVLKANSEKGDLGIVAYEARKKHHEKGKDLSISEVFERLDGNYSDFRRRIS